jgi:nickel transport protein
MSLRAFLLAGILLLHGSVQAHDLWIERDGALHTLAYGHERSGHEGAKTLEYKPESVKQSTCFNPAGREIAADRGRGYPATLRGDCAASWFLVSSGYWSKTPYGTRNLPKNEAGMVITSWLSVEGVKRIDQWGAGLGRALTKNLELVPLDDPLKLQAGDKVRLTTWYQGKPAAGVTVAYFGQPRGVSDGEGRVNIRLRNPGFQLIEASLELPLNDGKADKAVYSSSLQFEIP